MTVEARLERLEKSLNRLAETIKEQQKKKKDEDNWLDADDVKEMYGWGRKTLQLKRQHGELKNYRSTMGRNYRYSKKEIEKYIIANGTN